MNVHDLIFTLGLVGTAAFLLPMLRGDFKPPLTTSIPMAVILGAFTVNFYALGLGLSTVLEAANALGWAALALQRARQ